MNAFRSRLFLTGTVVLLVALVAGALRLAGSSEPAPSPGSGGLVALVKAPRGIDRASPVLERRVQAAISSYEARRLALPKAKPKPPEPFVYRFFPQAGLHMGATSSC